LMRSNILSTSGSALPLDIRAYYEHQGVKRCAMGRDVISK
jgi:hypothetical protein